MNCEFLVQTREKKKQEKLLLQIILWLSHVCPSISSYLDWNKFSEFSTVSGHMI